MVSASYSDTLAGSISQPFQGGFLTLEIRWAMTSGVAMPGSFAFGLTNAAGAQGSPSLVGSNFPSGQVAAGEEVQGMVVFDIGPGPYTVIVKGDISPAALIDVTI